MPNCLVIYVNNRSRELMFSIYLPIFVVNVSGCRSQMSTTIILDQCERTVKKS
jgi:hypothetical protein